MKWPWNQSMLFSVRLLSFVIIILMNKGIAVFSSLLFLLLVSISEIFSNVLNPVSVLHVKTYGLVLNLSIKKRRQNYAHELLVSNATLIPGVAGLPTTGLYIDECVLSVCLCSRVCMHAHGGASDPSDTPKDMQVSFTGDSKLPVGVNQSVNVFVYVYVGCVIDRPHAPVPAGMDLIPSGSR